MRYLQAVVLACAGLIASVSPAETVKLKATADVCLSSQVYGGKDEQLTSMGLSKKFKLKSVQEMAAIRFDAAAAKGREVVSAALFLRRLPGQDMLRHVRVSTVNQDWEEGKQTQDYGPPSGACYAWADFESKRPWAWGGSVFADVIMTSGNSLAAYAERKELADGWISVELTPELVYALVCGDSDGLAVCDGGNLAFHNNFIHSVQSGAENAPYIQAELGKEMKAAPSAASQFKATPAPEKAHVGTGAIKLEFAPVKGVFCWQLKLDGQPVGRWRVKHPGRRGDAVASPAGEGPTVFYLEDLKPAKDYELEVVAVAPGGAAAPPTKMQVKSSPALDVSLKLGPLAKPPAPAPAPSTVPADTALWAAPPLVKISPEKPAAMNNDVEEGLRHANAVWDGKKARVFGARGEYVSFQVCVENTTDKPLTGLKLIARDFAGPDGAKIGGGNIELYKNWYAQNGRKQWQPAYCVPIKNGQTFNAGEAFDIPDPKRKLETQRNQTFYVDIYIPKDAKGGDYTGAMSLAWDPSTSSGQANGGPSTSSGPPQEPAGAVPSLSRGGQGFPVELTVYDFELPDKLSFWPQLNTYNMTRNWHSWFRLAQQHRCVYYYRSLAPKTAGAGKDIQVVWDEYDKLMSPLVSGEAFKDCRRAGLPLETAALPFSDYWPTDLTPQSYNFKGYWPKRGDKPEALNEHYMTCLPIEAALSQSYKDAFLAVEKQFVEHFKQQGWDKTEMQCVFVGKNTHRTQFGINMWWTTDEPYHWVDWLALRFFDRLFVQGRGQASPKLWSTRADISRPQWQGLFLAGATDTVYFGSGSFTGEGEARRARWLAENSPLEPRGYGSANNDAASNHGSVAWILNIYLNGGSAALPWQSIGGDAALDNNDGGGGGGNALIVPGERFGADCVADIRLKAFRDAEQLVEYLSILQQRRGLNREQVRHLVLQAAAFSAGTTTGASADNASALTFSTLKDWQLAGLRQGLAKLITGSQ